MSSLNFPNNPTNGQVFPVSPTPGTPTYTFNSARGIWVRNPGGELSLDAAQTVSGVFNAARIPNLDASKITTGTLSNDRLDINSLAQVVKESSSNGGWVSESIFEAQWIQLHAITTDSNSNSYAVGTFFVSVSGSSSYSMFLAKYAPNGDFLWGRFLSSMSNVNEYAYTVKVDSQGDIIVAGGEDSFVVYVGIIAKYSPSGTLLWQKELSDCVVRDLALDSSNNILIVGHQIERDYGHILKLTSTGSLIWQRVIPQYLIFMTGVATDPSDNIIACGRIALTNRGIIVKYNASGTLLWQRDISTTSLGKVTVDSDSTIYLAGGDTGLVVVKISSSGTLIWVKSLSGGASVSTQNDRMSIKVSAGKLYIAVGSTLGMNCLKFALDGRLEHQIAVSMTIPSLTQSYSGIDVRDGFMWLIGGFDVTNNVETALIIAKIPTNISDAYGLYSGKYSCFSTVYTLNDVSLGGITVVTNTLSDAAGSLSLTNAALTGTNASIPITNIYPH